ncbi:hypothetical protein AXK12_06335 [Cephaloticoccus capnophilus]|uniref:TonB-dependent receptor plug domain-containing protein n=1 Tax=Cephaloticoccus capnophilus TaxID=1548208 RepID=A0A139SJX1_9BACT|nr:TonB-dependent receptor plug domain-containing protein [Cephaloticoccus capnophilus]KXU34855.1 hypothetical protein AXK12_06335 [Cephaloticoccus capnophilus]
MKSPQLLPVALGLCAFVCCIAPELVAQSSPYSTDQAQQTDDETVVLPAFSVAGDTVDRYRAADAVSSARVRTQLIETPSSITVLPRDLIEDIAPTRVYDATKYIAGVQDGRGNSYQDRITLRGFELSGRTVNSFADTGNHNFDEALIERIEVSKGPNAILSPGGPPGGTVNIVTKAPEFRAKHSLTALVGDFDAQKVTLDTTAPLPGSDRFAYRLIAAYQDTERYLSSTAKLRNKVIAPQLAWRISPTSELVVRYDWFETRTFREQLMIVDPEVVQRGQTPSPAPGFNWRGTNGTPPWSGLSYQKHSLSLEFSTSFNQYLSMRLAGRFQRTGEGSDQAHITTPSASNRYNPYTGILTPNQTWALADPSLAHDANLNPYVATNSPYYDPTAIQLQVSRGLYARGDTYSIQNDWVLSFDTPYAKLQTVAGFAGSDSESVSRGVNGTIAPLNLFDIASHDSTPTWDTALSTDNENEATNWQAYLNQRVTFWEDRIALTGGALHYDTQSKSRNKVRGTSGGLDASKDMFLGSALVRVTPNASLYYSYSTNAAPATFNSQPLWREGKQHEWGAKMEFFERRLGVNFAYFEITQTNFVVANPAYYAGDLNQPTDLLSDYSNHGAELEVMGALTRNLSVMASVTNLKMRDARGRNVRAVADHLAAAMLNYRLQDGALKGLSFTLGANYASERAGDIPVPDFTPLGVVTQTSFFVPSHTRWSAGASYQWSRYTLRLMVDNLTDKKNYFSGAGARFSQPGLASADGRNIRGTITVRF